MLFFSASFWYAYAAGEYSAHAKPNEGSLNFFRAAVDAANPSDLVFGILRIFNVFTEMRYASLPKENDHNIPLTETYGGGFVDGAADEYHSNGGHGRRGLGGRRGRRQRY